MIKIIKNTKGRLTAFLFVLLMFNQAYATEALVESYYRIAYDFLKAGEFDDADYNIDLALQIDKNHAPSNIIKGVIITERYNGEPIREHITEYLENELKRSLKYFNRALAVDDNILYRIMRAYAYYNLSIYQDCVEEISYVTQYAEPEDMDDKLRANLYQIAARCDYYLDNYQAGLKKVNKAIKLNNQDNYSYNIRAIINIEAGNYADAKEDLINALQLYPDNHMHIYNRGYLKFKTGDYLGARQDVKHSMVLSADRDHKLYYLIAAIEHQLKNNQIALVNVTKAIKLNPKNHVYYNLRGIVKLHLNNIKGAKEDFIKALSLDTSNVVIMKNLEIAEYHENPLRSRLF